MVIEKLACYGVINIDVDVDILVVILNFSRWYHGMEIGLRVDRLYCFFNSIFLS